MRITLDLDDDLMDALLARHPGMPTTEGVERALRADRRRRPLGSRVLAATLDIEDVSAAMRRRDRTT